MTINTAVSPDQDERRFESFKPDMTATETTKVWAADALEPLSTRLIFHSPEKCPVEVSEDAEGTVWRRAFVIVADPQVEKEFRIFLFAGATIYDLKRAEDLIARAKAGAFNPDMWKRRDSRNNWVSDKWFVRRDVDEGIRSLVECSVDVCIDAYHSRHPDDGPSHRMESTEHPDGHYSVNAHIFDEEIGWQTWVDFGQEIPDGRPGMAIMRAALNDLEWLQAECDKLNAAAGTVQAGVRSE